MTEEKRIKPFLATHYNTNLFGNLSKLACPPYDVISKEQQKKLYKTSSYNFCHILLKKDDSSYKRLGEEFKKWLKNSILVEDQTPCFYITLQEFKTNSRKFRRRGFLGLLKLDGQKVTFPHEKTHSRPKRDRLKVIKSVKANLSPIFVIYPKDGKEPLSGIIEKVSHTPAFIKVTDSEKITYKVWKLTAKKEIEKITNYFEKTPLLIADGHHRFEVAHAFFNSNKRKSIIFRDLNYILAYFSPQDENLLILPTHRVLKKRLELSSFLNKLSLHFAIKKFKNLAKLEKHLKKQKLFSFGFLQDKNIFSLSLKDKTFLDKIYGKKSSCRNLETFLLHNLVFGKIAKIKIKEGELFYTKEASEACAYVRKYSGCGFIIRAPLIKDVMDVAFKRLTLPQKTTYFYPKFLSGLILRKLY